MTDSTDFMAETSQRMEDARKVLRKAAELIRERGWCRGRFWDEQGRLCVLGACNRAKTLLGLNDSFRSVIPYTSLLNKICATIPETPKDPDCDNIVVLWNDHVCTDAESAARMCERAAER